MADPPSAARIVPSKPHFFKPLLPGFHQGLLIPTSFFKYLNVQNPDHAVLRTSFGKWQVKINSRRFDDGWSDFATSHDLHMGDFLVFRHEGEMVFDVFVFDPSACEREYPDMQINKVDAMEEQEMSESESESKESLSGSKDICDNSLRTHPKGGASGSKTRNPYFVSTLMPHSCSKGYKFYIPIGFAREHGLCNKRGEMIIKHQGRSWQMRLSHNGKGRVYMGYGWHDFRTANCLKEGDTFSLELIDKGKRPVWVFHRTRGTPRGKVAHQIVERMSEIEVPPKYYITTLSRSNFITSELYIPMNFAKLNGLEKYSKMTMKDPNQRDWQLYLRRRNGKTYVGQGWKELAKANGLKAGHIIKLELMKSGKSTLLMNFSFQG